MRAASDQRHLGCVEIDAIIGQRFPTRIRRRTLALIWAVRPRLRGTGPTMSQSSFSRKDEPDLIARALRNDEAALRAIMRQCNRRLYRIARSIVRDDSEAEDVVQAAYGRAFTSLREFRGESGICTWLARIALNE